MKEAPNAGMMAAAALEAMSSINRIRSGGGEEHEVNRIAEKFGSKPQPEASKRIPIKYIATIAISVAAAAAFFCVPERHDVSGRAWAGKSPLQAEIKFHHEDGHPISVTADQKGEFKATGLKPGKYRITVHAQGVSPVYSNEASSPITIPVRKDLENVRIQVSKKKRS